VFIMGFSLYNNRRSSYNWFEILPLWSAAWLMQNEVLNEGAWLTKNACPSVASAKAGAIANFAILYLTLPLCFAFFSGDTYNTYDGWNKSHRHTHSDLLPKDTIS
jgi:hypothetical protein